MARVLVVLVAALAAARCDGESRQPVTPSPPPVIEIPAVPIARFAVRVDNGATVAVANSSVVSFDALNSSGIGLRYSIDFGDGGGVDAATATHVYREAPRTFKARVIVTDSLGRSDTATVDVGVRGVEGTYRHSFWNPATNLFESRTLQIVRQIGLDIEGVYTHPPGFTSPFTGALVSGRGAVLALTSGTIKFDGSPPNGFDSTADTLRVTVTGGSATGLTLPFRR